MILLARQSTPLGPILLSSDGTSLTGLWLEGQKYYPEELSQTGTFAPDCPVFSQVSDWLAAYFAGKRPDPDEVPLSPAGTAFQRQVWTLLREIPYGKTVTYGGLARKMAARLGRESMSAQAVGNAVGRNPISILIPCHRVLGADGSLTGYAGGLERKGWLLAHEQNRDARK